MLSHAEMSGAAGIKLFGKVITTAQHQPVHRASANAAAAPPSRADLMEEAARARAAAAEARLPCPRCRSLDTKFCYFNNYNINQPRHFCRACHRYWTAGGALRNVPVGSGRRKNRPMAMLPPVTHAAIAASTSYSGSGSPPVFASGFAVPHLGSSSQFATSLQPAYTVAGLPQTTEQWWWHVTSSTAEHSVALDRAF